MWKNYFVFGIRHYSKNRANFLISFLGLAVSILVVILIGIYILQEYAHDENQENSELIYRLEDDDWALLGFKHGSLIAENFPEVESIVHMGTLYSDIYFKNGISGFSTPNFSFVDSSFFDVFTVEFIYGNPQDALKTKNTIVLTESSAKRLFGDEDPMGKQVKLTTTFFSVNNYTVSAVIKDLDKLHFKLDAFSSMGTFKEYMPENYFTKLGGYNLPMYFKMKTPILNPKELGEEMGAFLKNHPLNKSGNSYEGIHIRPLTDIYFGFNGEYEALGSRHGSLMLVWTLTGIGILILLIACVNFVNLAIAKASLRYKEIGVRKVVGAYSGNIFRLIFAEVSLIATMAVILGWGMASFIIPILDKQFGLNLDFSWSIPLLLLSGVVILLVSLLAGLPASTSLAFINPIVSLKGGKVSEKGGMSLKYFLLGFQFLVSGGLIVGTIVLYMQNTFLNEKDLGINKEQIYVINNNREVLKKQDVFVKEIRNIAGVNSVTLSASVVSDIVHTNSFDGFEGKSHSCRVWDVEADFEKLFDIELVEGRLFDESDEGKSFLINEVFFNMLDCSIEKINELEFDDNLKCIGVVKNFNFNSIYNGIFPLKIRCKTQNPTYTYVRLDAKVSQQALKLVEEKWDYFSPDVPIRYRSLSDCFDENYKSEKSMQEMFSGFSLIAIIIMCFGILGVIQFILERKTKEIAVRVVLGAQAFELVQTMMKQLLKLVLITSLISGPIAYYYGSLWLDKFVEHISFPLWPFLVAFIFHVFIVGLMLIFHIFRIFEANPMKSLKSE